MVRAPYFDKNGIKKGAWSEEEDRRLSAYIERHGHPNWRQLPKFSGLARCGKSCRLRWMNYLRPNLKRGNYTQKEEEIIIDIHQKHGNKWSLIAEKLPGRTDNEIKNYWHSHLKKVLKPSEITTCELKSEPTQSTEFERPTSEVVGGDSHHTLESSLSMSSETSYTEDNSPSFSSRHTESTMNRSREEDSIAPWETFDGFSSNFWTEPFISENAFSQDYCPFPSYGAERDDLFSSGSDCSTQLLYQAMQEFPKN